MGCKSAVCFFVNNAVCALHPAIMVLLSGDISHLQCPSRICRLIICYDVDTLYTHEIYNLFNKALSTQTETEPGAQKKSASPLSLIIISPLQ